MPLTSTKNAQSTSIQVEALCHLYAVNLAQWIQHYQAETVDLRYFFHSGWSS
ncbi:hypothetical protein [Marinomonas primoryensis]|uniref:Uncharacterized protein n=1 Tax=Marinomonas primoryensis TaxID=178399 RepID=A0A859D057_9GAMM|nr:hypothetical protein [Marinomonas primoryensis]QKK82164.1 uncharacterized protein MP3633_3437 [Marinomonas primoryensis]